MGDRECVTVGKASKDRQSLSTIHHYLSLVTYRLSLVALGLAFSVFSSALAAEPEPVGLYDYPRLHVPHSILRVQLMQAVRAGNITNMEAICRKGLELMPGDATWQYNLACALAYRATPDAALAALDKAVKAGFRNAKVIEEDNDLKRIASDVRFKAIVQEARETADLPVPGVPRPQVARLTQGTKLVLTKPNLSWNFDRGLYIARFTFLRGVGESAEARAALYEGPAKEVLKAWLADGTAAGNGGDLYINRDRDHSRIKIESFPLLSELRFEGEAKKKGVDKAIPNTLYPGSAVVGNASLAIATTNDSCSLIRMAMLDPASMLALQQCYLDNQFWVFPAHKDYDPGTGLDRFMGVTPCAFQSVGSSGSDRYYVRAALAASAALQPKTKSSVLERNLFGPLMQYLLRRTRKGVETEDDYLSSLAHPTAFDRATLDVTKLAQTAHRLTPEMVPPVALPLSAFVPVRPTDLERELDFRFMPFPADIGDVSFTWHVVHGEAQRVKISPQEGGAVHLSVDCRELTNRIDVACFAKTKTSGWGAPSFVCIYPSDVRVDE